MSRGTNTLGVLFLVFGVMIALASSTVMIVARSANMACAIIAGIGVAVAILGALFIEPEATKAALGSLVGQVGPYVPGGGRRASDPDQRPRT